MNHFFRYPIHEHPPSRYLVNPVRVVQAFLCLGCLGLAIYLIAEEPLLHRAIKVILGATAAAFAIITVIDVISNTHYDPITRPTWAMLAMAGAISFFICTGLLLATYTGVTSNLVIGEILFGVTGIMFLLDAFYLLCSAKRKKVRPLMLEEKTVIRSQTRIVDAGHISEEQIESIHERYEGPMYPPYEPPPPPPPRTPPPCAPPPRKPECRCPTTTYGGTFYMSKDATPLPSPEPTRVVCRSRSPQTPRTKHVTPSTSQMIEKVTETTRICPGKDCGTQLSDGTPLIPMQTETSIASPRRNSSPRGVAQGALQRRNSSSRRERSVERLDSTGTGVRRTMTSSENVSYKPRRVSSQRQAEHRVMDKSVEIIRHCPCPRSSQRTVGVNSPRTEQRVVRKRSSESISRGTSPNRTYNIEERVMEKSETVTRSSRKNQKNKVRERSVERLNNTPRSSSSHVIIEKRFLERLTPRTTEYRVSERSVERPVLGESHKVVKNRSVENVNYYENSRSIQRCPDDCPSDCHPFEAELCVNEIVVPCPASRTLPQNLKRRSEPCVKEVVVPCPASRNIPQNLRRKVEPCIEEVVVPCPASRNLQRTVEPCVKEVVVPCPASRNLPQNQQSRVEPCVKEVVVPCPASRNLQRTVEPCVKKVVVPCPASRNLPQNLKRRSEPCVKEVVVPCETSRNLPQNLRRKVEPCVKKVVVPCPASKNLPQRTVQCQCQYEPKEIITIQSSETITKTPKTTTRTVAVSTRMVPKASITREKCHSAPAPEYQKQVCQRPVKSAEYATQSSSRGDNFRPLYSTKSVVICSAASPCGLPNCTWCREKIAGPSYQAPSTLQHPVQEELQCLCESVEVCSPPQPLQTISECECETDPSSTWDHDQVLFTGSEFSTVAPTLYDNVREIDNTIENPQRSCGYCCQGNCPIHKNAPQVTSAIQTSETRMIRAHDLQDIDPRTSF